MEVKIYTDGACIGNPGPGGWAAVILTKSNKKEIFGGEKLTTNNRMELTATIKALEYCDTNEGEQLTLKEIKIYTDSTYAIKCCTTYGEKCARKDWVNPASANRQTIIK